MPAKKGGAGEETGASMHLAIDESEEAVQVGDELDVRIERVLSSGQGQASIKDNDGYPYLIFVRGRKLKMGEVVKVSIVRTKGGVAEAVALS
jgi:predicted RNA-binding protein with TRAM domain